MKIKKNKTETAIEGKHVRLRAVTLGSGDACIEIDARGPRGWTRVLSSERSTVAVGARTELCGVVLRTRNKMIMFPQKLELAEIKGDKASLLLKGTADGHTAEQRLTLGDDDGHVNVQITVRLGAPARPASLGAAYIFIPDGKLYSQYEPLDFCWIPHLRRKPEHVIGDHIFRSPAVIYQTGEIMAALAPDLDTLGANRRMPTVMDARLDNPSAGAPAFWYGFCNYKLDGHVFFEQAPPAREPLKGELRFGVDLIVSACEPERAGARRVLKHLWRRYGQPLIARVEPQTIPFDEYARRAYGYAFDRGRIWREFDIDGVRVGAILGQTFAGPAYARPMKRAEIERFLKVQKLIPRVHGAVTDKVLSTTFANDVAELILHYGSRTFAPYIMNQAWFNNVRTAYGAYAYGEKFGDAEMKDRALKMKEYALRAPGDMGLIRSCCFCPEDGEPIWMQGSKGFEAVRDYHLPDSAWTGWWMLRWYEELERDERLLERAKRFGAGLREMQLASGAIPGWVRVRRGNPTPCATLRESPQTAAPGMFLARLGRVAGCNESLAAARRAADFLIANVFQENKWWDFETFFSCSKKDFGMRDTGTGLHCMNNLCIFWTAELMRELAESTGKQKYLDYGLRAVDLLLMWQQVWDAPYISINTFGGFGVMNTDGEWNDARQSMFSECLTGYYELTGDREYFERGVAALRSSFTTMLIPENKKVAPGNMGLFDRKDEGASYENYGHLGYDRRAPGYLMFDWGSGGACAAAARLTRRYGDIYIDAARGDAFGLDICTALKFELREGALSIRVDSPHQAKKSFYTKAVGLKSGKYKVSLNGKLKGSFSAAELRNGVELKVDGK